MPLPFCGFVFFLRHYESVPRIEQERGDDGSDQEGEPARDATGLPRHEPGREVATEQDDIRGAGIDLAPPTKVDQRSRLEATQDAHQPHDDRDPTNPGDVHIRS